nr:DUF4105 domain-containing protein [uncultured Prevotella sp.]
MKQLKRTILCLLTALMLMSQTAAADNGKQADSIRISLLTCMPRPYVYSLYGHTAIRYENLTQSIDIAINYGIFSFSKPYFVLRFVFGLTDYEMGIEYFEDFKVQYERSGCGVIQQTLNLTDEEKTAIAKAIDKNYLPENRVYRYNYFYDNCTTRARDIILDNINGKVVFENEANPYPSFRELIHQYNERHRWARFGNDLLLGVKADCPTTFGEQQFLPKNLSKDINHAVIYDKDGSKRKFVESETWVLPATSDSGSDSFPVSPIVCLGVLAALVVAITTIEAMRKANYWLTDTIMMFLTGACGLILFAMIFSQHPTVSLNLQILLLNPLNLVFLWSTSKKIKKGQPCKWQKAWTVLIILFLLGGIIQSYAEGIYFVALSLLYRNIMKIRQTANTTNKR